MDVSLTASQTFFVICVINVRRLLDGDKRKSRG